MSIHNESMTQAAQTTNVPTVANVPKHELIRKSIYGIDSIFYGLQKLLRKIRDVNQSDSDEKCCDEIMGSLSGLLVNGSHEIDSRVREINEIIEEIENELF